VSLGFEKKNQKLSKKKKHTPQGDNLLSNENQSENESSEANGDATDPELLLWERRQEGHVLRGH